MNTEHTTETWTAYQNPEDIGSNLWHVRVAEGLGGSMHGYCGKPKACLIAAAPDLLEALKATLVGLKEFQRIFGICVSHGERMGGWLEEVEEMIAKIEPAIAKAEGKA